MRWRTIVALWALAGLLGVLYELDRPTEAGPQERAEGRRPRLVPWSVDDIDRIDLVRGALRVVLARSDGRWVVEAPSGAVPHDLVVAFVESVTEAEVLETIPPRPLEDDPFRFDARAERIELVGRDRGRLTLDVGDPAPTGTATYVRTADGHVRVIGRNAIDYRDLILDAAGAAGEGGDVQARPAAGH